VDQGSYSPDPDVRVPLGCKIKKIEFIFYSSWIPHKVLQALGETSVPPENPSNFFNFFPLLWDFCLPVSDSRNPEPEFVDKRLKSPEIDSL
jgi:hypothetical protein